ncbi:MAG: hypothetical protein J6R32_06730 [Bacteroidales bacterium]|nr:hypothetical protein [Bacteroidales bacterium]
MKNIINALTNYGFESRPGHLFAGRGSWTACGETIKVSFHGDMVTIDHHEWFWDGADTEWERSTVATCHLSRLWESLPEWVLKR